MTICVFTTEMGCVVSVDRKTSAFGDGVSVRVAPVNAPSREYAMTPADATKLYDALAGVLGLLDSDGNTA